MILGRPRFRFGGSTGCTGSVFIADDAAVGGLGPAVVAASLLLRGSSKGECLESEVERWESAIIALDFVNKCGSSG